MPPIRVQPVIAILALVGLFAISVLVGYVGGQAFLTPSSPSPRTVRPTPSPAGEGDQSAAKPAPATPARPPAPKRQEPTAPVEPPAATPAPPSTPAPAPRTGERGAVYRVQVGAYISQVNAEARLAKLRERGFDAYVIQTGGLYRVQVGAFAVRENAERMADRLRAAGYEVLISP